MANNQEKYNPEYPIIDVKELVPREQINLVPENSLSILDRAELANLRRGIDYRICVADTPQNRESVAIKTAYFQMVAFKEGWAFDPQKYQVRFVDSEHPLLSETGTQKRIYEVQSDRGERGLSPEGRIGFLVKGDLVTRMGHKETDGLVRKLLKHVFS